MKYAIRMKHDGTEFVMIIRLTAVRISNISVVDCLDNSREDSMEQADQKLLQFCYAGALVDAANNYALLEGTDKIEAKKVREQRAVAAQQLGRFGAKTPAEVLTRMKEVFGCTEWRIEEETELVTRAVTASCLMCAIARKSASASPCKLFCINPMTAYADALDPNYTFTVEETLWEGTACRFVFERR